MITNTKFNIAVCCFAFNMFFSQHKFLVQPAFDETDLKKTNSLIEKSAPAEILYNSVRYHIANNSIGPNFLVEKEYYSKIKIYDKKNAEEWLNIEIPIYSGNVLDKYEVKVYNLVNNKVEKILIDKKEQLKENFTKGLRFFKLAIPNVSDGAVIEYKYKISSSNIFNTSYFLEYNIPVVYQEFNLEYPHENLDYTFDTTGTVIKPDHQYNNSEAHLGVSYDIIRFGYENTKSKQKESFVKDLNRNRAKVRPEVKSYSAGNYRYTTFKSWNKIAELLYTSDNFGNYLNSNVKDILPESIKTYYDPLERANKIFNFVKENYKWNRNDDVIASQGLSKLLKTKSGNSADINLFLIMLLRNAGIEANPVLISTTDHGILNITAPGLDEVNFVLASVKINDQIHFYDGTSYASKANLLPERDWNDFGILIEKDKGTDLSFSNTNISKKEQVIKASVDLENSIIKGTFTQKDNGMFAIEAYDEFDFNKDKYNESFKTKYGADIKEVESKLTENGDFETQMKFSGNNLMDVVGSKIVINPFLFLTSGNDTFNQTDERRYQIDFISAFEKEKRIELEIPADYKVTSFPKDKKIQTDDKEIAYSYKSETVGNKLIITSKINIASQNYPKEYYPFFKQVWKVMSDSENQVIILVKK
ncbi:transglutaminase domain-containing protein [Chryseobacterium sp. MIQD13]|uniref:transglutaminase domain-containing protein n=1 Tax=Chryseobacterium sp. MIQD13 TaxID=3422310 RepID=UPI003D2A5136